MLYVNYFICRLKLKTRPQNLKYENKEGNFHGVRYETLPLLKNEAGVLCFLGLIKRRLDKQSSEEF